MPELRAIVRPIMLTTAALLLLGLQISSHAAQSLLQASPERLLGMLEATLSAHQVTILEQAETDRFALIFARHENGGHVTITIRQMPADADRSRVGIRSDNPVNPNFDNTLLAALQAALEAGSN